MSELIDVFKASLDLRLKGTLPGLRSKRDISKARHAQYTIALNHISKVCGSTLCVPLGKYHIEREQLATIIEQYRSDAIEEMKREKFSGHWFNERMKSWRMFVSFLTGDNKSLCDGIPSNIETLTEKFAIPDNPTPIPLPILRALWKASDDVFRNYMLIALNMGFRQTEISLMERSQIKTIGGHVCINKLRGKTGVPIAIPIWKSTQRGIEKFANKEGRLFLTDCKHQEAAIAKLAHRMKKIKDKIVEKLPEVKAYTFENFRDTGASFIETINPMLAPLYLGNGDTRQAKAYIGAIQDEHGKTIVPMDLESALRKFEVYLGFGEFKP